MRIFFPNAEHDEVFWAEGRLSIGSSEHNRVRLNHPHIKDRHIQIDVNPIRGIELGVLSPGADVYVNGRLVQAKAILRLGDKIQLGSIELVLKSDSEVREEPPPTSNFENRALNRVNLRAIGGPYFGKILPLKSRSIIGRGSDCDIVLNEASISRHHVAIEHTASGLYLRDLESINGTLVNGNLVKNTQLKLGDQIAFEQSRFILENGGPSPIELLSAAKTPPMPQAVHTLVARKLVPPPPARESSIAAPQPMRSEETTTSDNSTLTLLANLLMILAGLSAILGLAYLIYIEMR